MSHYLFHSCHHMICYLKQIIYHITMRKNISSTNYIIMAISIYIIPETSFVFFQIVLETILNKYLVTYWSYHSCNVHIQFHTCQLFKMPIGVLRARWLSQSFKTFKGAFKYILMLFFGFFILLQALSHCKINCFVYIVDTIALLKFPFGSFHEGNPPQIVTVGRYEFLLSAKLQLQSEHNSLLLSGYLHL